MFIMLQVEMNYTVITESWYRAVKYFKQFLNAVQFYFSPQLEEE